MSILICSTCTFEEGNIRREVRRNEKRRRKGLPPVMEGIAASKRTQADCAARGHYDSSAAAHARWDRA